MDLSELSETLSEKFSELSDRVTEFCQENKQMAAIIGGLVLVILICLVMLVFAAGKKDKKQPEKPFVLELSEPLVIPNGPELPKDYNISRKTQEKWTEQEADQWFTVPGDKEIDGLAKSNENIVNEIIGAAP